MISGVYFEIGYDLSISKEFPAWSTGSPYKQIRDKMMGEEAE